jgi:hypothetical protein
MFYLVLIYRLAIDSRVWPWKWGIGIWRIPKSLLGHVHHITTEKCCAARGVETLSRLYIVFKTSAVLHNPQAHIATVTPSLWPAPAG